MALLWNKLDKIKSRLFVLMGLAHQGETQEPPLPAEWTERMDRLERAVEDLAIRLEKLESKLRPPS